MEESERIIYTKRHTYRLPIEQEGRPVEELLGLENSIKCGVAGAKVYDLPDGRRIIAKPDPDDA